MQKKIVVFGPVFVDIKGYPFDKYFPRAKNSGRVEYVHGGVSRNIAEDIANVGLDSTFISLVDDNAIGKDVSTYLSNNGVNTQYIKSVSDGMGTWLAIFEETGDVISSISKRPTLDALNEILDENGDEIISNCDAISLEIDLAEETDKRVFALAKKYNKPIFAVVSNMNIAKERIKYFDKIDCLICNRYEMGLLFNASFEKLKPKDLATVLVSRIKEIGVKNMIVTVGGEGSVYATKTGEYGVVPACKVNVVDTTGAGDSFFAGVLVARILGKSLEKACKFGSFLAGNVIQTTKNVCDKMSIDEIEKI